MGGYFNWLVGLVSLLGFVLTLANQFPKHRLIRNYITILCFGALVGSLLGSIKHIDVTLPSNPATFGILLFYIASLVGWGILLIAAVTTSDKEKRERFLQMIGNGFAILLIVGVVMALLYGMITHVPPSDVNPSTNASINNP